MKLELVSKMVGVKMKIAWYEMKKKGKIDCATLLDTLNG